VSRKGSMASQVIALFSDTCFGGQGPLRLRDFCATPVYQLLVSLEEIEPKIWRRLWVPDNLTCPSSIG
jgi:hypothetical protein